ncbi:MAG: hypothetical protein JST88_10135 [Bacteroidetes bacterium]|nr:hypothetical protein [Bacteroidota bacterium]
MYITFLKSSFQRGTLPPRCQRLRPFGAKQDYPLTRGVATSGLQPHRSEGRFHLAIGSTSFQRGALPPRCQRLRPFRAKPSYPLTRGCSRIRFAAAS